ncbi:MAG: hypothetical protein KAH95_06665 [Spirochaetales bacterium]|nr:hypothetical protein [Spirochaetales bacterium]
MAKKTFLIFFILFMATGIFALDGEITGRDVVTKGALLTLEGIFEIEDAEWYLRTDDKRYSMHKGRDWYTEEIGFIPPEGEQVTIEGFVLEDQLSPCTITVNDTPYAFRTIEGFPLWSGSMSIPDEECSDEDKEEEKG